VTHPLLAQALSSDVEDLFSPSTDLKPFNGAYKDKLAGTAIKVSDLPLGDRIVRRIEEYLDFAGTLLRPSGGFNHYLVAKLSGSESEQVPEIGLHNTW